MSKTFFLFCKQFKFSFKLGFISLYKCSEPCTYDIETFQRLTTNLILQGTKYQEKDNVLVIQKTPHRQLKKYLHPYISKTYSTKLYHC